MEMSLQSGDVCVRPAAADGSTLGSPAALLAPTHPPLTHPSPPIHTRTHTQIEWGARDPTAGELESNFSEKTLGNWDTSHIIR
jgi:hypothetical protein